MTSRNDDSIRSRVQSRGHARRHSPTLLTVLDGRAIKVNEAKPRETAVEAGSAVELAAVDNVDMLTEHYKSAFEEYQIVLDRNFDLCMSGGQPSAQSAIDEKLAFQKLTRARHLLVVAAERAYPTMH